MSEQAISAGQPAATVAATGPSKRIETLLRIAIPVGMLLLAILTWHFLIILYKVPHYILPAPAAVAKSLYNDWHILFPALLVTLRITFTALFLAVVGGVVLAVVLVQNRWIELALTPYVVVLQVTPIIAIAPLLLIYTSSGTTLLICAFLVAFFPILSNMVTGLKSVDHNLLNLFELYGTSRWKTLINLKLPASMPYFLTGLRIGGGLALIASVVAEFTAGAAGVGSGLAFRLLESGFRLNVARMFACLVLLTGTGVAMFGLTSFISWAILHRWHESALRREN